MADQGKTKYPNKRQFPRLEAKCLVSYEYFDEELTEDIEGMGLTQNLSAGGILIEIDKEVRRGATLFVELALKDHVIKATGKIAHSKVTTQNKYDVGVCFTQIKPSDIDILKAYFNDKGIQIELEN